MRYTTTKAAIGSRLSMRRALLLLHLTGAALFAIAAAGPARAQSTGIAGHHGPERGLGSVIRRLQRRAAAAHHHDERPRGRAHNHRRHQERRLIGVLLQGVADGGTTRRRRGQSSRRPWRRPAMAAGSCPRTGSGTSVSR